MKKATALTFFLFCQVLTAQQDKDYLLSYGPEVLTRCRANQADEANTFKCVESIITSFDEKLAGGVPCENIKKTQSAGFFFCQCKKMRLASNFATAITSCKKAIEKDPTNDLYHLEAAFAYIKTGDLRRTEESLQIALALNDKRKETFYLMAENAQRKGDFKQAAENYKKFHSFFKNPKTPLEKKKEKLTREKIAAAESALKKQLEKNQQNKAKDCAQKYLSMPDKDDYETYDAGKKCSAFGYDDKIFLKHSKISAKLGKYEEAENSLKQILKLSKNKQIITEANILLAEQAMRAENYAIAVKHFEAAYNLGYRDYAKMLKYSQLCEMQKNYPKALEVLTAIYDGQNQIIKEKIAYLSDFSLSEKDMLDDLILRGAVSPNSSFLGPYEKKLFLSVRLCERKNAVEYMKKKYMGFGGLWFENMEGNSLKLKLTAKGFSVYMRDISQKAIRFFEKKGISLNEVFKLRTLKGDPIFEKNGRLTDDGLLTYFESEINPQEKNWLRIYEEAPTASDSGESEKINEEIKQLFSMGHMEMTKGELDWLGIATDCPEEVLFSPPCSLKKIKFGEKERYFICYKEGLCSKEALTLSIYLINYRNGDTSTPTSSKSTAFFGTGGNEKRKFCYKNKIWNGMD